MNIANITTTIDLLNGLEWLESTSMPESNKYFNMNNTLFIDESPSDLVAHICHAGFNGLKKEDCYSIDIKDDIRIITDFFEVSEKTAIHILRCDFIKDERWVMNGEAAMSFLNYITPSVMVKVLNYLIEHGEEEFCKKKDLCVIGGMVTITTRNDDMDDVDINHKMLIGLIKDGLTHEILYDAIREINNRSSVTDNFSAHEVENRIRH